MTVDTTALNDLPDGEVLETIARLQASARYLRHMVIATAVGLNSIVVWYGAA